MPLSLFILADRFRRATSADAPALRAFFAQHLNHGAAFFDANNPFDQPMTGLCVPMADVWMATVRRKVVAAGWFHLRDRGVVNVVALTAPDQDKYTDPLLAYIEAALRVMAHEGRVALTEIKAWLPEGAHQPRLIAAYTRHGWTRLEPTWWTHLHRAELRRTFLNHILERAPLTSTVICPYEALSPHTAQSLTRIVHVLRRSHQVDTLCCAVQGEQVIAFNAVKRDDHYGAVLTTKAGWLPGVSPVETVDRMLAATMLSHRAALPDLLIGAGDFACYQAWFSGVLDVEVRDGFTLTIDASRPPTHWEYALGFNPRRIWLVPGFG